MPRRSKKYLTTKKYRKKAKKIRKSRYRRKRFIKGRRGRFKKYHVRKRLAKTYGLRKYAGIKWTRYLTLAEFLTDDKWDLQWAYTFGANNDGLWCQRNGVNWNWNSSMRSVLHNLAQATFSVFSTDLWSNKIWQLQNGPCKGVYLKSYNPFPSDHNLGPLFEIYQNQYKKFKYVGMKVKWIPGVNKSPSFVTGNNINMKTVAPTSGDPEAYQVNVNTELGSAAYMQDDVDILTGTAWPIESSFTDYMDISVGKRIFYEGTGENEVPVSKNYYYGFSPALALRLWINFDKKGYESIECPINSIEQTNVSSDNALTTEGRFKLRRVFDDSGYKKTISESTMKSYSLLKPFKFFVRPKLARKMQEDIENETVVVNAESNVSLMNELSDLAEQQSSLIQTSLKVPYLSTFRTYPSGTFVDNGMLTNTRNDSAIQIAKSWTGKGFFDPILFGWGLSCDNLPLRQQLDFFGSFVVNTYEPTSNSYNLRYQITEPPNYSGYGKFKVTYYCRFKEFNPIQHKQWLAQENAIGMPEISNLHPQN